MSQSKAWEVGQELKPLVKPAITREQLRDYAAASGDNNLIHLDENFAKQAGFPSVIVHGMISMAFMADHLLMNFPSEGFAVGKIKARFRKVTFPGDVLTCEGKFKKLSPEGRLVVSLATRNQNGEITAEGEAELRPLV